MPYYEMTIEGVHPDHPKLRCTLVVPILVPLKYPATAEIEIEVAIQSLIERAKAALGTDFDVGDTVMSDTPPSV